MWIRRDIQLPDAVEVPNIRIAARTALRYLAYAIAQAGAGWSTESPVHEFATDKFLSILTNENGAQVAFGCSLDGKLCHADNEADETLEGYLHCCYKPSSGSGTLSNDNNPFDTSTWCSDAGAYTFAKVSLTKFTALERVVSVSMDADSGSVILASVTPRGRFDTIVIMLDDLGGATNFSALVDGEDDETSAFLVVPASSSQDLGGLIPPSSKLRHRSSEGAQVDGSMNIDTDPTATDWDAEDPPIIDIDLLGKGTLDSDIVFVTSAYAPKNTIILDGILHLNRGLCLRIGINPAYSASRPLIGVD